MFTRRWITCLSTVLLFAACSPTWVDRSASITEHLPVETVAFVAVDGPANLARELGWSAIRSDLLADKDSWLGRALSEPVADLENVARIGVAPQGIVGGAFVATEPPAAVLFVELENVDRFKRWLYDLFRNIPRKWTVSGVGNATLIRPERTDAAIVIQGKMAWIVFSRSGRDAVTLGERIASMRPDEGLASRPNVARAIGAVDADSRVVAWAGRLTQRLYEPLLDLMRVQIAQISVGVRFDGGNARLSGEVELSEESPLPSILGVETPAVEPLCASPNVPNVAGWISVRAAGRIPLFELIASLDRSSTEHIFSELSSLLGADFVSKVLPLWAGQAATASWRPVGQRTSEVGMVTLTDPTAAKPFVERLQAKSARNRLRVTDNAFRFESGPLLPAQSNSAAACWSDASDTWRSAASFIGAFRPGLWLTLGYGDAKVSSDARPPKYSEADSARLEEIWTLIDAREKVVRVERLTPLYEAADALGLVTIAARLDGETLALSGGLYASGPLPTVLRRFINAWDLAERPTGEDPEIQRLEAEQATIRARALP